MTSSFSSGFVGSLRPQSDRSGSSGAQQNAAAAKNLLDNFLQKEITKREPMAPLVPIRKPCSGFIVAQATTQRRSAPNQAVTQQDKSPENRKTPKADLGAQQRIATAGETVPIVFGKRVSNNGGVWVQPSLARAGSALFVGSFLFPVSQGEIVSSPVKHRVWVGLRNMAFLADQTITISAIYDSAADLATNPSVCPILGAGLYCGNDTYTYLTDTISTSGDWTERQDYLSTSYWQYRTVARGSGDVTNSVIEATLEVYDNVTGNDLTTAYFTAIGLPTNTVFAFNYSTHYIQNGTAPVAGAVGVVQDYVAVFGYNAPDAAFWTGIGSSGNVSAVYTISGVNNQADPGYPASSGTLEGVQYEYVVSKYADPASTPTADNSAFADITFLKVVGNIYDPPESGSYPTTTRQVSVYYEQGVSVDLYSVGLVSGVYTQGASNQLVDLAMYLFTIYKRTSNTDPDVAAPIYTGNMEDLAAFCDEYSLHFNGVISDALNIVEFLSETAPYFLLSFQSNGGQYRFEPLLPLNGSQEIDVTALTPAATFTEDEILPGSFSKTYVAAADKTDVNATVLYRLNDPASIGTQQSVQVRYSGVSLDAPVEQFDMSDFCANRNHAVIYAKHFLARRRFALHTISFATPLSTAGLIPTDVIKIERQRITSTGDNRTEIEWYQITAINHQTDGTTSIEASQFPVNGSNIARISNDVLNGTFTVV
jgi:hypothetical protein